MHPAIAEMVYIPGEVAWLLQTNALALTIDSARPIHQFHDCLTELAPTYSFSSYTKIFQLPDTTSKKVSLAN
jgi:hypothetical protein